MVSLIAPAFYGGSIFYETNSFRQMPEKNVDKGNEIRYNNDVQKILNNIFVVPQFVRTVLTCWVTPTQRLTKIELNEQNCHMEQ